MGTMIKKQSANETAVSLENSNSSIKVVVQGREPLHYLNTLQEVNESLISSLLKSNKKIYTFNKKKYITGVPGANGSGGKDESRYYSEAFKRETAIALSQIVTSEKQVIKLVTGLPASLSERDDLIKKMKENLIGNYIVEIEYDEYTKEKKSFSIADVVIVSQPVGTLWSYLYNQDGKMRDFGNISGKAIKTKRFLILDVGYGTTDLVELSAADGLGNNKNLQKGMSDYIANLYNEIEREYPESHLSAAIENPYELDEMLIDNDILSLPRDEFDVSECKNNVAEQMATEIKNALDKYGYNFEKYHEIILTGGGCITLFEAIRKVFNNDKRVKLIDRPLLANALGFYIISKQYYKL